MAAGNCGMSFLEAFMLMYDLGYCWVTTVKQHGILISNILMAMEYCHRILILANSQTLQIISTYYVVFKKIMGLIS